MYKSLHLIFASLLLMATSLAQAAQIEDAHGQQLRVPDLPQRVIALSELDLDASLALGLKPIAATMGRGQAGLPNYLGEQRKGIAIIGQFASPILDKVLAARPDLILAGGLADPTLLAQLSKIAPTVQSYKLGEDWQTALRRIGQVLNRNEQAKAVLQDYAQQSQRLRAQLSPTTTVSVLRWNPQGPAYMLRDAFARRVLADLGLASPAAQQQAGIAHSPPLSLEALGRIDADWLFVGTLASTGPAAQAMAQAKLNPAYGQLRAVKNGQLRTVDGSLWTSLGGPLAAKAVLQDVASAMRVKS